MQQNSLPKQNNHIAKVKKNAKPSHNENQTELDISLQHQDHVWRHFYKQLIKEIKK